MSYSIKRNKNTSAKFKSMQVLDKNFIDLETGSIIDVAGIVEKTFGDSPFDIQVTNKDEEDITPTSEE